MSEENLENPIYNPFHFTTPISDFVFNIAQEFSMKFVLNYDGGGDTVIAKLSGNPKRTGIKIDSVVHEADGTYSIHFYGTPREINKNDLILTMRDNRDNIVKFPITFQVNPVKVINPNLPDATALFTPYIAKIYFVFPENFEGDIKPKFGFNFPVEFGFVKNEDRDGTILGQDEIGKFTTITFNPSKPGKYKFNIDVLSPDNILLGYRTMHLEVFESLEKKIKSESRKKDEGPKVEVKAVDINDWK